MQQAVKEINEQTKIQEFTTVIKGVTKRILEQFIAKITGDSLTPRIFASDRKMTLNQKIQQQISHAITTNMPIFISYSYSSCFNCRKMNQQYINDINDVNNKQSTVNSQQ